MFWVKCVHQLLDPTCLHVHTTEKPHVLLSVPENWTKRFKHEKRVDVQMQFALGNEKGLEHDITFNYLKYLFESISKDFSMTREL